MKKKVSQHCHHPLNPVKPISCNNRQRNLNIEPETSLVGDIGIYEGSEVVFLLGNNATTDNKASKNGRNVETKASLSLEEIFGKGAMGPSDAFFDTLVSVLEALSVSTMESGHEPNQFIDTQRLVWNLLSSVP